jgi:hypothetical protein
MRVDLSFSLSVKLLLIDVVTLSVWVADTQSNLHFPSGHSVDTASPLRCSWRHTCYAASERVPAETHLSDGAEPPKGVNERVLRDQHSDRRLARVTRSSGS